jgi:hypothetical protein
VVFAVQAFLAFRNASRRDTISQNIQTRVAQAETWGPVDRVDSTTFAGDPAVTLTVRFTTKAEADLFWTDVQAAAGTGVNGPVAGSRLWRHDCPHDQADATACAIADSRVY